MKVLFDSNIIIDHFQGVRAATDEMDAHRDAAVSALTWTESLTGPRPDLDDATRWVLRRFRFYQVDREIALEAAQIRRTYRLKTVDAVIFATARLTGRVLVTRDLEAFGFADPGIHIPYTL